MLQRAEEKYEESFNVIRKSESEFAANPSLIDQYKDCARAALMNSGMM